ncbi:MAG: LLM class F420-dependent oxidoreductase [Acetobacteraceae bacterium]|nr:LLM class F420-dependent oxidoreductase [Acetobacteraceae bacterium]
MQLGITVDMSGASPKLDMDRVLEAERLGFSQAWTGEAYGTDAVTPATWMLARTTKLKIGTGIMQIPARTPACAAMTAMTLQHLSGGRFLCGLGVSGPQVVEGWHGVRFGKPMTRTKEYIAIIRQILERKAPLQFRGEEYVIPYEGPDTTGLGKPLRSITHGDPSLKFYLASITPAGLRTAGECADGVLPIFYSPEQPEIVSKPIVEGRKKAGRPASLADFDVAPYVRAKMGPDVAACRDAVRPELALYIGGMGARAKNYYNDVAIKLGYEGAAKTIQDLYLDGKKKDAAAAVPDKLIDEISLVGPPERIADRLSAWKEVAKSGHLGTMVLKGANVEVMRVVAEAVL